MNHGNYEYLEQDEINGSILDGSDFTLIVKHLPKEENSQVLKAKLWQHLEGLLKDRNNLYVISNRDQNAFQVADINFGMSDYGIMKFYLQRTDLIKQQIILQIKIDILKDSTQSEEKKEELKKKLQKKLENVEKKKEKNEERYQKFLEKGKQSVVKAFVTFKSMEGKLRIMHMYNQNWITKCCRKKKIQHLYLDNKYLDIRAPTAPSLILWENLGVKRKERCIRISFVALVSFILMIITAVIIVYSREFQSSTNDEYGDGICPSNDVTQDDALQDQLKAKSERSGLMYCYCIEQFASKGFDVRDIRFSDGNTYCDDWLTDYSVNTLIIWSMVMVISMVNVMLKTAMRMISVYERRHDKTDLVISNTIKMFIVQFINTAVLILVVNAQVDGTPDWFPVLNGQYDDFTTEWYKQIGVSIILTMMIGIISPHIANGMFHCRFFCKRWIDRKCTCNRKRTRQLYQGDYENMYMGPELLLEYRYSTMMNTIFITLMYGAGMPVLYVFASVSLFLTYWVDKITFLRIYQTPPRYDIHLQKTTREWTNLSVILHFLVGFWMYSNSEIFDSTDTEIFGTEGSDFSDQISDQTEAIGVDNKLNSWHALIYFIALIAFIFFFFLRICCLAGCRRVFCKCCFKNKTQQVKLSHMRQTFCNNYYGNLEKAE